MKAYILKIKDFLKTICTIIIIIFLCYACVVKFIADELSSTQYPATTKTIHAKWKFKTDNNITTAPVINDKIVCFSDDNGTFYSVDIRTGEIKWKFKANTEICSATEISKNIICIGCFNNRRLYSLDTTSGKELWGFKMGDWLNFESTIYSTIIADGVVFFSTDKKVYALDLKTGLLKWIFTADNSWLFRSAVFICSNNENSILHVGCNNGYLYGLDMKTGEEKWRFDSGSSIDHSPLAGKDSVFFKNSNNNFYALASQTGKIQWKTNLYYPESLSAVYDGTVYFNDFPHWFTALDAKTGTIKWKLQSNKSIHNKPVVINGIIYFGSSDGTIYAVDKEGKGQQVFNIEKFNALSFADNSTLFFTVDDKSLSAYEL